MEISLDIQGNKILMTNKNFTSRCSKVTIFTKNAIFQGALLFHNLILQYGLVIVFMPIGQSESYGRVAPGNYFNYTALTGMLQ